MSKCNSDVKVLIHPEIANDDNILKLAKDFKRYKTSGDCFSLFGRDCAFIDEPALRDSSVHKVHIIEVDAYDCHIPQYNNTCDSFHLIYCRHPSQENLYCIIHVLTPNAHAKARHREFVSVAERRAEFFISKYSVKSQKLAS